MTTGNAMGLRSSAMKRELEVGEPVASSSCVYAIWSEVLPCVEDRRRRCTLFVRHFADTDSKETRAFFENGIKTLRQLRHPYVVQYIDSSQCAAEVTLLTERLWMLDLTIDSLPAIEVHTGLSHILDALIFLHDRAGLSHNNVCPSSVFVAGDGRWKLGSFECAQKLEDSRHWVQSDFVRSVKVPEFASPEDKMMLTLDIPPTARDAFAFGRLVLYALPFLCDRLLDETVAELEGVAEQLTDEDPSRRGALSSLARSRPLAFTSTLAALVEFLQCIHLKSDHQKANFFASAVEELRKIPEEVAGRRVVPALLSRYVLLEEGAHEKLLPFVLRPRESSDGAESAGLLSEDAFKRYVVPELLKIFRVHETSVRLALLAHFHRFARCFSDDQLEKSVLPELVLGTKEVDDRIVCASLRAMADVVPLVGAPRVTKSAHTKIFADGTPKKPGMYTVERQQPNVSLEPVPIVRHTGTESKELSLSPTTYLSQLLLEDERSQEELPEVKLELVSHSQSDSFSASHPHAFSTEADDWATDWESTHVDASAAEGDAEAADDGGGPTVVAEGNEPERLSKALSLTSAADPSSAQSALQKTQLGSRKSDIGSEYEIPSIGKVSFKSANELSEPDYFADMEPVISRAPSLLDYLSKEQEKSSRNAELSEPSEKRPSRFAAVADDDVGMENISGQWDAVVVADWDSD